MDHQEIFKDRSIEEDTLSPGGVLYSLQYDNVPVLVENWWWDGVAGSSRIVPLRSLEASGMSGDDFFDLLKDKLRIEGSTIEKESKGFLFLNFNLRTADRAAVEGKCYLLEDDDDDEQEFGGNSDSL